MIRRFWRLARARKGLLIEAMFFLLLSRVALAIIPFRRVAARLGTLVTNSAATGHKWQLQMPEQVQVAGDVSWAVSVAARSLPFKVVCLPQAFAAKLMLERRSVPCAVHLGVATHTESGKDFEAHAWLDAAGVKVTGYPVAHGFVEIVCFV